MERDFKGVWIPRTIWTDDRLSALEKVILAEVDSLDKGEEGCYASNKYLAEFCQCSETKVSMAVSKLIEMGYLKVAKFDGRTRVLKSCLSESERQTLKKCKAESQKVKATNIETNTNTNTLSKERVVRFQKPTLSEVEDYIEEKGYHFSATAFWCHYEANGWKVGRNPMKDWHAACTTWEHREYKGEVTDDASAKFRGL